MGVQAQVFRLVDERQHVLDVAFNLYVPWFRKRFWLVIMVRFCHLRKRRIDFPSCWLKGSGAGYFIWESLGAGVVTSPPSAEVTIQRQGTEEERDPKVEPSGSCEQHAERELER